MSPETILALGIQGINTLEEAEYKTQLSRLGLIGSMISHGQITPDMVQEDGTIAIPPHLFQSDPEKWQRIDGYVLSPRSKLRQRAATNARPETPALAASVTYDPTQSSRVTDKLLDQNGNFRHQPKPAPKPKTDARFLSELAAPTPLATEWDLGAYVQNRYGIPMEITATNAQSEPESEPETPVAAPEPVASTVPAAKPSGNLINQLWRSIKNVFRTKNPSHSNS